MSLTQLQSVSKDIANGQALWGLLRANRILDSQSPLRRIISSRARTNIADHNFSAAIRACLPEIISGACLNELPEQVRVELQISCKSVGNDFNFRKFSEGVKEEQAKSYRGRKNYKRR